MANKLLELNIDYNSGSNSKKGPLLSNHLNVVRHHIGKALRHLLTSIPGVAITMLKLKGQHGFNY